MSSKTALWFSRHVPTAEQIEDVARMGYVLQVLPSLTVAASRNLVTDEDAAEVYKCLCSTGREVAAKAVFGVFAAPIMSHVCRETVSEAMLNGQWDSFHVPCYAAWNVTRTPEGGKPTFHHKVFLEVGRIRF